MGNIRKSLLPEMFKKHGSSNLGNPILFLQIQYQLMRRSKKPEWQQQIANERIEILFNLAEKEFKKHPARSQRYVQLARKIGLRYNVRLIKTLKRRFCKNCNILLKSGITSRTRLDSRKRTIIIKCLNCNKIYRQPY